VQRGTSASDDVRQLTRRTTIRRRSVARSTPNVQSQVTVMHGCRSARNLTTRAQNDNNASIAEDRVVSRLKIPVFDYCIASCILYRVWANCAGGMLARQQLQCQLIQPAVQDLHYMPLFSSYYYGLTQPPKN